MNNTPIHCLHDEVWPIEKFIENPRNPNRHPVAQVALLAQLIIGHGWRSAIVVSKRSGFVVKGHGRLTAARHAGLIEAPVELHDYETEAEEWADMIADNRLAELSERDNPAVLALVKEIQDEGEVSMTGFTESEVQAMELAAIRGTDGGEPIVMGAEASAAGKMGHVLRFGKNSFPLSDEEYTELLKRSDAFKAKNSTTYGFVSELLALDQHD